MENKAVGLEVVETKRMKGFVSVCRKVLKRDHAHVWRFLVGRVESRKLAWDIETKCPELWNHPKAKPGRREEHFGEGGKMWISPGVMWTARLAKETRYAT